MSKGLRVPGWLGSSLFVLAAPHSSCLLPGLMVRQPGKWRFQHWLGSSACALTHGRSTDTDKLRLESAPWRTRWPSLLHHTPPQSSPPQAQSSPSLLTVPTVCVQQESLENPLGLAQRVQALAAEPEVMSPASQPAQWRERTDSEHCPLMPTWWCAPHNTADKRNGGRTPSESVSRAQTLMIPVLTSCRYKGYKTNKIDFFSDIKFSWIC